MNDIPKHYVDDGLPMIDMLTADELERIAAGFGDTARVLASMPVEACPLYPSDEFDLAVATEARSAAHFAALAMERRRRDCLAALREAVADMAMALDNISAYNIVVGDDHVRYNAHRLREVAMPLLLNIANRAYLLENQR